MKQLTAFVLAILLLLVSTGCGSSTESDMAAASTAEPKPNPEMSSDSSGKEAESASKAPTPVQFGLIAEQILSGADGDIHYSYYLPESYDGSREYPLMVVMPGYDMMWFGESSSGRNINWSGFTAWTKLDTEMIVVSAQLTDWHETSARQAIELTEYSIGNFAVDTSRVYATGYSAGGETMSRAVSLRPDLLCGLSARRVPMGRELRAHCRKRCGGVYLHGRGRRVLRQREGALRLRNPARSLRSCGLERCGHFDFLLPFDVPHGRYLREKAASSTPSHAARLSGVGSRSARS